MSRILALLKGELKRLLGRSEPDPDPDPRYGESVNYTPCPNCAEGSLVYDDEAGAPRCNACGAVDER